MEVTQGIPITPKHWKELVAEKKGRQAATIPKEWILTNLPPKDKLSVIDFPEKSGLLTARDIEITNTEVDELLSKLAKGIWSAVDVTTAFSKRAVIAHQLVRNFTPILSVFANDHWSLYTGQLLDRDIYWTSSQACR